MKEFRKLHQFIVFAVNTPIQLAISEFMKNESNIYSLNKFYQNKRDLFSSLLKDSKFILLNCIGTYFQLLDYSNISNKNDFEFSTLCGAGRFGFDFGNKKTSKSPEDFKAAVDATFVSKPVIMVNTPAVKVTTNSQTTVGGSVTQTYKLPWQW